MRKKKGGQNHNRGMSLTEQECIQLREAFAAHCITTPLQRYRIRYDQELHGNYRRDPEDVDTKWFTDALVDCEILQDDSFEECEAIEIGCPKIVPKDKPERIIITIYY